MFRSRLESETSRMQFRHFVFQLDLILYPHINITHNCPVGPNESHFRRRVLYLVNLSPQSRVRLEKLVRPHLVEKLLVLWYSNFANNISRVGYLSVSKQDKSFPRPQTSLFNIGLILLSHLCLFLPRAHSPSVSTNKIYAFIESLNGFLYKINEDF